MNHKIFRCDADDVLYLRLLAEKYHSGKQWERTTGLPDWERERTNDIRNKLMTYGFTDGGDNVNDLISEKGLEYLHELDNPPPIDYWKDITVWFKSRWWSVPIFVIVVSIPLVKSWFEIVKSQFHNV